MTDLNDKYTDIPPPNGAKGNSILGWVYCVSKWLIRNPRTKKETATKGACAVSTLIALILGVTEQGRQDGVAKNADEFHGADNGTGIVSGEGALSPSIQVATSGAGVDSDHVNDIRGDAAVQAIGHGNVITGGLSNNSNVNDGHIAVRSSGSGGNAIGFQVVEMMEITQASQESREEDVRLDASDFPTYRLNQDDGIFEVGYKVVVVNHSVDPVDLRTNLNVKYYMDGVPQIIHFFEPSIECVVYEEGGSVPLRGGYVLGAGMRVDLICAYRWKLDSQVVGNLIQRGLLDAYEEGWDLVPVMSFDSPHRIPEKSTEGYSVRACAVIRTARDNNGEDFDFGRL